MIKYIKYLLCPNRTNFTRVSLTPITWVTSYHSINLKKNIFRKSNPSFFFHKCVYWLDKKLLLRRSFHSLFLYMLHMPHVIILHNPLLLVAYLAPRKILTCIVELKQQITIHSKWKDTSMFQTITEYFNKWKLSDNIA